jgi:hypothetical protein
MREGVVSNVVVTVAAAVVLAAKFVAPERVDLTTVAILILALLPWLSSIVERAELPGGGSLTLRRLEVRQRHQQDQIDGLRFLLQRLVSPHELEHLRKLRDDIPLLYSRDETRSYLDGELRRLINVGLLERRPGHGLGTMGDSGDVRQHFEITEDGRRYLDMVDQMSQPDATQTR